MTYLLAFLIALLVFFLIDIVWLGFIAKDLYQKEIGALLKKNVNWIAAIIFYFIFIGGLVFFALRPAIQDVSFSIALLHGGMYGFIAYATYDLTNLATMKDWPLKITIIDLIWGTFLGASSASVTYLILTWLIL